MIRLGLLRLLPMFFAASALLLASCEGNLNTDNGEDVNTDQPGLKPDEGSGIFFEPQSLNADQPCTIILKPSKTSSVSSSLYNCTGDIYVHIGVFYDEDWKFVQAEWNQNIEKCRMQKVEENHYRLEIGPTIREYFQSGTTPLEAIALVFRSADGKKQTRPDQFVSVVDDKYKTEVFVPDPVVKEALPSGVQDGINYNQDGSVTLVLHDKARNGSSYDYAYVIGEFSGWERLPEYAMKRDDQSGSWWYTMTGPDPDREYMFQYHIGNSKTNFRLHDAYSEVVYDPWNDKYIPSSTYPGLPAYPSGTKDRVGAFKINRNQYSWEVKDFKIKDENNLVIYEMLLRDFTSTHDINGALEKLDYIASLGVNAVELMPVQEFEGNDSWGYNPCSYFALDKAYGTREMYKRFIDECHKRGLAVILDVVYNHTTGAHPFARLYWNGSDNVSALNPSYNVVTPHGFGVFQDINHQDPFISGHIKRNLAYLLTEYKVDGFRFDLTKGFTNNSGKDGSYDQQRVDVLKGYNDAVKEVNPDAMVILEHFIDAENNALGQAGMHLWGNCNHQYSSVVKGSNADLSYIYDPNCYRVGYMESHDEERICYGNLYYSGMDDHFNEKMRRASLAAAFFLMVPGPKMIWQFGELGYDFSINEGGQNVAAKPIRWEFLDDPQRMALHDVYAGLLKFRNENPELFTKGADFRMKVGTGDFAEGKFLFGSASGKSFCVMGNFDREEKDITASLPVSTTWYNRFDPSESITGDSYTARLKPGEFRLLVNFK